MCYPTKHKPCVNSPSVKTMFYLPSTKHVLTYQAQTLCYFTKHQACVYLPSAYFVLTYQAQTLR